MPCSSKPSTCSPACPTATTTPATAQPDPPTPARHHHQALPEHAHQTLLNSVQTTWPLTALAQEAGPGGQVGGDVRGDDPAAVDLPGLRRQVAQAHGLGGAHAAGLDDGVLAVGHVDVLRVVAARDVPDAAVRDVRADDRVPPAGLLLISGQVLHLPAGRVPPPA